MSTSYLPYEPQQQRLMPDALQDWLPEGHLAYFISDTVDRLDLSGFHARYAKGGPRNQPFHPLMMVKVDLTRFNGLFRGAIPHSDFLLIGQRKARRSARVWLTRREVYPRSLPVDKPTAACVLPEAACPQVRRPRWVNRPPLPTHDDARTQWG